MHEDFIDKLLDKIPIPIEILLAISLFGWAICSVIILIKGGC